MGVVYSFTILNAFWFYLKSYILRNLQQKKLLDAPKNFTIGLQTWLPLVIIHCSPSFCLLKWVWEGLRLFSDVWSENAALFKRLRKFIQIHQYYTAALKYSFLFLDWNVLRLKLYKYSSGVRSHLEKKFHGDLEDSQMSNGTYNVNAQLLGVQIT